ncbi:MAG: hypothetical protein F6K38_32115 [Moorea sp. SIO3B2]|nr:hypothetical protein [Moorena sp. SIO3B2]NEQ06736.1 hypothetical protein [Moorena sp. SIO4E2]
MRYSLLPTPYSQIRCSLCYIKALLKHGYTVKKKNEMMPEIMALLN